MTSPKTGAALFLCLAAASSSFASTNFYSFFGTAQIAAVALDTVGNIYVTGSTTSPSLPVTQGAFQQSFVQSVCGYLPGPHGSQGPPIPCPHAFVAKIDSSGRQILWATYLGGESQDGGMAICVDNSGNVYVAGQTSSTTFPVTTGSWISSFPSDSFNGFLTKLSSDGSRLMFSTYLPGAIGSAVTVDASGDLFVTGAASGSTFPATPNAYQQQRFPGNSDAFVLKMNPSGSAPLYSTLLGGTFADYANALAIDRNGDAYVAGVTASIPAFAELAGGNLSPFPTTPGALYQPEYGADVFLTEVNPSGSGLISSSVFGGLGNDSISSIALTASGAVYFTGSTDSVDWPLTASAPRTKFGRGMAGEFSADGSHLLYSTYLAGAGTEIVLSANGDAVLTGYLVTPDLATTPDANLPCASNSYEPSQYVMALTPAGATAYASFLPSQPYAVTTGGTVYLQSYTAIFDLLNTFDPPAPGIRCIVNAANFFGGSIAPGEIVSIFGPGIGPAQPASAVLSSNSVSTRIGGTQVLIGGYLAPLLYISSNQINAIAPFEIVGQTSATVQVDTIGLPALPAFTQSVAPAAPGIFTSDGSGNGPAAALNQDGSVNSESNPATQDSIVTFFATGLGAMQPQPTDGSVPDVPSAAPALPADVYISGAPAAQLQYIGDAPRLVEGAVQINAILPPKLPNGAQPVSLSIGGSTSPSVTIFVK